MEFFVVVFIVVLGLIVIGSIMGMTSSGRITKLEQQNRNLNERIKVLESLRGEGAPTAAPPETPTPPKPDPEPVPPAPEPKPVPAPVPEPVAAKPVPQRAAVTAAAPAQKSMPQSRRPKVPEKPSRDLEELIGGQWSVWVGGLALLVGAVLLIRFSIEAGFFGPGARILMAFALGAALLLAGEWLKRSDDKILKGKLGEAAKALQQNASVPGLLSAVGIFTWLGASYAAHALYGLIPALAAFIALAVISLGAMALSLRQGPLLAGIGLLASLATPLLIQTDTPSLLMLVVYLVLVGGAALALSRLKSWGWLATGTVFGWLGWSFLSRAAVVDGQLILWSAFLALGFITTVWTAQQYDPDDSRSVNDNVRTNEWDLLNLQTGWAILWGALAAMLVLIVAVLAGGLSKGLNTSIFILGIGSIAALTGASLIYRKQSGHLVIAGLLGLVFLLMAETRFQTITLMLGLTGIVILSCLNTERTSESGDRVFQSGWSIFAVALGLVSVVILDMTNRAAKLDMYHAAIALGFTALFAGFGVWLSRRGADRQTITAPVIGAGFGWVLAAILGFDNLGFSLFLSLGSALAALALWQVRIAGARKVLLGLAGLTFAHALLVQFPDKTAISSNYIFNELWIYLALPAFILAAAGVVLHGRKTQSGFDAGLNGFVEAAALAGFALFAVFQIRHLSNGGEVYAGNLGHAELGLQVSIGLCFTLAGLSKRFAGNFVLSKCAEIISYVTLAIFALGSLLFISPFFARGEVISGNIAFNSLTTGLLVPTVLLGLCAVMARGKRPESYINILGGLALAGVLSWVTAMIRFLFNGAKINIWSVEFGPLELWTISAVWLAFGVALLALGVWRKERALRIASGVVIILTVLKAFLIDMAGLEGVLRALSFVALGLILIVIGRAYQRYWLSGEGEDKTA